MKLTYLGTGNAFAPQRDWGCILVNDAILLDAPPSLLVNLKRLALPADRISHLFLSHFHGDHYFGLPFLLLEYYFLARTEAPLAIIGPSGVAARVQELMALAYPDIIAKGWPRPLHFVEAQPGVTQTVDGLTFTAVAMRHGGAYLTALGYRLTLPDGQLAYTGDTSMTEAIFTLIEKARLIILEADSAEQSAVHLGQEDLRTILARVPEDSVVFLNHLDTPDAAPWHDFNVIIPQDLASYTVTFTAGAAPEVCYGR